MNLATRLEKATVEFRAPLIITGSTFMGQTQVKGKAERIALYEFYGMRL